MYIPKSPHKFKGRFKMVHAVKKFMLNRYPVLTESNLPRKPHELFGYYCSLKHIDFIVTRKNWEDFARWLHESKDSPFNKVSGEFKIKFIEDPRRKKKTWADMPTKINGQNNYAKYLAYMKSKEWALFRKEALKHYGKMCNRCKRDELPVEVHHLTYERIFKELLIDVEILCKYCHKKEHTHRKRK